jgi:selenocysteine lyase/cysteine desulfurase
MREAKLMSKDVDVEPKLKVVEDEPTTSIPEPDIPIEALESVDLGLPTVYLDEVMASKLLDVITSYHQITVDLKASRHQGDHSTAEVAAKAQAQARNSAALIQYEHPNTLVLYPELARAKALVVKEGRKSALEGMNGSD